MSGSKISNADTVQNKYLTGEIPLRIASRKSDLARLQSYLVGAALKEKIPHLQLEFNFRESLGDVNLTNPLWQMPEKGVFTEDFYQDLVQLKCDLVVHSWKDLPIQDKPETEVVATLERADARDIFLLKKTDRTKKNLKIFTSSPRRIYNLEPFLKMSLPWHIDHIEFLPVRGNILTRLEKLNSQMEISGMVMAKAALDRLLTADQTLEKFQEKLRESQESHKLRKSDNVSESFDLREKLNNEIAVFKKSKEQIQKILSSMDFQVIPLSQNPAAAAQGALAVEIKRNRPEISELLNFINYKNEYHNISIEREILGSYGGGCHQKIGIHVGEKKARTFLFLKGLTESGEVLDQKQIFSMDLISQPKDTAHKLFQEMLQRKTLLMPHLVLEKKRESIDFRWDNPDKIFITKEEILSDILAQTISNKNDDNKKKHNVSGDIDLDKKVIWTSGVSTWKKLAQKGCWVNGTFDSLGEDHEPEVQNLICDEEIKNSRWVKFTHEEGASNSWSLKQATYRINYQQISELNFKNIEGIFWSHGKLFEEVLKVFPEIVHKYHFCGLGHTFELLKKHIEPHKLFTVWR